MNEGYVVSEQIDGANPLHPKYPLLPGDLLVRDGATWMKDAPGLAVGGFVLTEEQVATLRRVEFVVHGLTYISTEVPVT